MAEHTANDPWDVLSDGSDRTAGEDARSMNVSAATAVADAIRTTLGPFGMDKMLVGDDGNVIVTNDGVTLLDEMQIDHPTAGLVLEVARAQEGRVGDGTTSAVIFAGELLAEAGELMDQGLHATNVAAGYDRAASVAADSLRELATHVHPEDTTTLTSIAETAMTGKGSEFAKAEIAEMVVSAVQLATWEGNRVERRAIDVKPFPGGSTEFSRFLEGVMVDYDPPSVNMPTEMTEAKVLIYEGDLEVDELTEDAEASVGSFQEVTGLVEREEAALEEEVQHIVDVDADLVLVNGGIDEFAQGLLADAGILALRHVRDEDRMRVGAAAGAKKVPRLADVEPIDLGWVGRVRQEKIRDFGFRKNSPPERTLVLEKVATGDTATLLLRGGTEHVLDEIERSVEDALGVVASAVEDGTIVPGGGAAEIEMARDVRDAASGVGGREQLAVEAFADALEVGPRVLAENAGTNPIDALANLRARHDEGYENAALDATTGETVNAYQQGVLEPHRVKATALAAAVEVATSIVRIDDVIAADGLSTDGDGDEA